VADHDLSPHSLMMFFHKNARKRDVDNAAAAPATCDSGVKGGYRVSRSAHTVLPLSLAGTNDLSERYSNGWKIDPNSNRETDNP
jgi:hypothetical protein